MATQGAPYANRRKLYVEKKAQMNYNQRIAKKKVDALLASAVIPEEQELADALIAITEKHGKFNSDDMGVWAGYETAEENENREIGVTCANCILYNGGSSCKIIDAEVEPGGYCRFALIPDGVVTAAGSKPAPKKDRIYGSKKNKKGSASGGKKITFSAKTEKALANKVKEHNEKAPAGRKATLGQLKAVYRRGAGAYSSSHRPGKTRDQWAMARVNAYLKLLKSGRPSNPNYKQDNDLLPKAHPKSTNSVESMTASALAYTELIIALKDENEYQSPEHAIVAFAEYSGLGYETIPAFRAAWLRAVDDHEIPFERARDLAINLYSSKDADLLPKEFTDPDALVAVGKNWRSVKAKLQRRDRYGRFAEMGGGFSFVYKGPTGPAARVTGTVVGQSGEEDVDVKVKGSKVLQDGVYSVPASKGESVKAVISNDALKQAKVDRGKTRESFPSDTPFVSRKDIKKRDKKGNVIRDPEQQGPRPTYEQMYESNEKRLTDPVSAWTTRPDERGQRGMKIPGERVKDPTPKEAEDMINAVLARFKKTEEELAKLAKQNEGRNLDEEIPLRLGKQEPTPEQAPNGDLKNLNRAFDALFSSPYGRDNKRAKQKVKNEIEKAVDDGLLSKEQADRMIELLDAPETPDFDGEANAFRYFRSIMNNKAKS